MDSVDAKKYPGLNPIASSGALCPASTTSTLWLRGAWPIKPDVVAEGGNGCLDGGANVTVGPESLRLLTTNSNFGKEPFAETGDTSAAAAHVARLCANLKVRYPAYWPETIRALVVHGAVHTQPMKAGLAATPNKAQKEAMLRTFGFGLINDERSVGSSLRRPTYVVEKELYPYRIDAADKKIKLGNLDMHELPWPTDELAALGEALVQMKVTLSYFIEPNPSSRGWQSKFRYQSYGLRFAVKGASEDDATFARRVNQLRRIEDEEEEETYGDPDSTEWALGAQLRVRGSVHSDVWQGTAARLAGKSAIAVFPVGGWWKDWTEARQGLCRGRYSLVISLEIAESVDVDLYTPIANAVEIAVRNAVEIDIDTP